MAQLEFGILGPLRARYGDAPVTITRPRERTLLAALLVSHGTVVSVDDLAGALWGDELPGTARRQIMICVSRLRQALAAAGAPPRAIETCEPGYLIASGRLDTLRFEELAAHARTLLGAGRPPQAARVFRRSLRLWRGPVLHGIDRPFATIEAARLEERRNRVTEELVDCELGLGKHAELVGELRTLLAADPLRDRFRGQLMLALYRAGRPAEALETYRSGRALLVESLGLEPGPELRGLHEAMLRGDPGLLTAGAGAGYRAPAQLPPDTAWFTGREAELGRLDVLSASRNGELPVAVISGAAGAGKTALAVHWGQHAASRFPDGQLFADLRGYHDHGEPLSGYHVLDRFLRELGVPGSCLPAGVAERTALFRTVLSGRRVLIVLDNVRSEEQARPLLPGSAGCFVLVTSRDRLDGLAARDGAVACRLGPLPGAEAARLLTAASGGRATAADADRIAALCDRLPLAIRIAGAKLSANPEQPVSSLIRTLADRQRRLPALRAGDIAVRSSLELSYRELPERAAMLFRRLGLLDVRDFATWMAAALLDCSEASAAGQVGQLVRASLAEPAGTDRAGQQRFRLHDLVQLFAREHATADDAEPARHAALGRVFGAALYLAELADGLLGNPFVVPLYGTAARFTLAGDSTRAVRADPVGWLEAERPVLTGAVIASARLGFRDYPWELTSALCQFLSTRRYLGDWLDCAEAAAAAARSAGDERGEAAALLQLADRYADGDRLAESAALADRAVAVLRRLGTGYELAAGLATRAMMFPERPGARADAEEALALLPVSAGAVAARGRALSALGLSHLHAARLAEAADSFGRMLACHTAAHCVRGAAEARYRLGTARLRQGDYLAATGLLGTAMLESQRAGDLMTEMVARIRLGQAYLEAGEPAKAEPLLAYAADRLSAEVSARFRTIVQDGLAAARQAPG